MKALAITTYGGPEVVHLEQDAPVPVIEAGHLLVREGVDVVFDAVGRTTLRHSFRATKTRGLVVNYGSVSGSLQDLDPIELGESGSLFLTRPRLADHMQNGQVVQARADAVFAAIREGDLTIDFNALHGLQSVIPAHARIEARQQIGKEVVWI